MQNNSSRIYTLPLFPLNYVMFPHTPLPLHIFEERYRVMISDCIDRDRPFGVVLIREGLEVGAPAVPEEVGCVARILDHRRLEDGRIDIITLGTERFRLLEYMEADLPYLVGRVEPWDDENTQAAGIEALADELREGFLDYVRLLSERAGITQSDLSLPDETELLSYYVGFAIDVPFADKQRLLALRDTRARVDAELGLLRPRLQALRGVAAPPPPSCGDPREQSPPQSTPAIDGLREIRPMKEGRDPSPQSRHDARN